VTGDGLLLWIQHCCWGKPNPRNKPLGFFVEKIDQGSLPLYGLFMSNEFSPGFDWSFNPAYMVTPGSLLPIWIGFLGKILTGNHDISHEIWGFPATFPLNQSIDVGDINPWKQSRGVLMLDHHSNWDSQRTFSTNHYCI